MKITKNKFNEKVARSVDWGELVMFEGCYYIVAETRNKCEVLMINVENGRFMEISGDLNVNIVKAEIVICD